MAVAPTSPVTKRDSVTSPKTGKGKKGVGISPVKGMIIGGASGNSLEVPSASRRPAVSFASADRVVFTATSAVLIAAPLIFQSNSSVG